MRNGWVLIVVGAMIGLIAGLGVRALVLVPLQLPQWEKLPPTTSPVTEIGMEGACPNTLNVRTVDDTALQLSLDNPESWLPRFHYTNCSNYYYRLTEPCNRCGISRVVPGRCDLSSEAFLAETHPPADIRACLEYDKGYVETSWIVVYALDSKGTLWRWEHYIQYENAGGWTMQDLGRVAPVCLPIVGIIFASWSLDLALKRKLRKGSSG